MDKSSVFNKIAQIQNLPTLPAVIDRLNKIVEDRNANATSVSNVIQDDPVIMSRILRVVNSAFYGVAVPVASIQQAVTLLGFVAVKNIAMTTSAFSAFNITEQADFNREEFWRHSICVGIATNVIYQNSKGNIPMFIAPDMLHLAGLVHGIGIIIFEQYFRIKFMVALLLSQKEKIPLVKAEEAALGVDHSEVGAWLGKKWNMPAPVVDCIRWHNEPGKSDPKFRPIVNLCHAAKYICTLEKLGDYGDVVPIFNQSAWKELGLSVQDIPGIVEKIKSESVKSEILLAIAK